MLSRLASFSRGVLDVLDALFAAGRVAGALEHGARPNASDLRTLGIQPNAFSAIRQA